jgi:thioredoxin reductase
MREVIIIGSGPAGYTAAIYAARAGLKPLMIASSVEPGGELMKTTEVENFPGFPGGLMGPDLMAKFQEQAESFGTEILLQDVVEGGDSAMEEALFLTRFASKVYVIHRRDSLKASKIMQDRAFANPKIEFIWNKGVEELLGDPKLTGIRLKDTVTGEESQMDLDGLFIAIGNDPRVWLVENQLELTAEKFIKVDGRSSKTTIEGVFACGDVIDPTYRQAITAAGSGCVAALDAEHFIASH